MHILVCLQYLPSGNIRLSYISSYSKPYVVHGVTYLNLGFEILILLVDVAFIYSNVKLILYQLLIVPYIRDYHFVFH